MSSDVKIGYCGVCCDHCAMQTRIPDMAKNLKRFIDAYGYVEWIHNITQAFNIDDLLKGLTWFSTSHCLGCLRDGGMPQCDVRACCQSKNLNNCYFCNDFPSCEKLSYQKNTYKVDKDYANIQHIGYTNWLKTQAKKTTKNFDNINYLEERRRK